MIKGIQALLSGIFFTFILDFFLFLGIHLHYIRHYEIPVYYNVLFADHQNLLIFALLTLMIGTLTVYSKQTKMVAIILAGLFATVLLSLIPPIGKEIGTLLLLEKNQSLYDARYHYHGDIYYHGRDTIWIYDDELGRILPLSKTDIHP